MIVEGKRSVLLAGQAWVVQEDRELAWAERHVGKNAADKYILGKYVEAENANDNGHIFDTKELETAQSSIVSSPLNLLHHPQYIVGSFIASEMLYPVAASAGVEAPANAVVEALSVFWRYYFPEEYRDVEKAHNMGSLFYSMEAIPKSVTCAAVCGNVYDYEGRYSETYCDHLNVPGAKKRLNQPHFMGGALIIPPTRPGWKGADITEMSSLIEGSGSAERIYEGFKAAAPHLGAATWEDMMAQVLVAYRPETAKKFTTARRKQLAKQGKALPDGCLAGETLVATEDGPRRIADIVGPIRLLTDVGWVESEVRNFGTGPLLSVVLRREASERTVYATPNHRWYLADGRQVQTDTLVGGDLIPFVEIVDDLDDADGFCPADLRVAPMTEQSTNNPGHMIMVDVEGGPLSTRSSVSAPCDGDLVAEGASATLLLDHLVEVVVGQPVLAQEYSFADQPASVTHVDGFVADLGSLATAEATFGSAPSRSDVEVGMRSVSLANTTPDETFVLDGRARSSGRGHASKSIPFQVIAVSDSGREEPVFCGVVPGVHRFVLADGILTGNSYPIDDTDSLADAIEAFGREDPAKRGQLKAHIEKQAKALGKTDMLPDQWDA